ncbi:YlbF family regulator [Halovenus sp. WSH3]|uniref:YlbF family regulator n=1 Tax=Halovenus carboxidivorans TaxID=2692199 RepID=A0A6B0T1Y4_9EURY|nr:YlbF family regulator [Halovenus carboxidivorans]MXR52064.1 YlbF family regulator [Halovenus carboxidivorans]
MSVDSDTPTDSEQSIEDLARSLGDAIADLPEYQTFLEKQEAVEADEETQEKIAEFEQVRTKYMSARQRGEATQDDLRELQETQQELHDIPVMREYLQAENDLELRLQALNEYVSDPLAVDFGEKAGGCCED